MRVVLTGESTAVSDYLLSVGNRQQNVCKEIGNFAMPLPEEITVSNEQDLPYFVFKNSSFGTDPEWLSSRCIIRPTNAEVDRINDIIMRFFFREKKKIPKQWFCWRELAQGSHWVNQFTVPLLYATSQTDLGIKIALPCCYGAWTSQMVTVMGPGTSCSIYINMSLMLSSHVAQIQGREYSSLESLSYQLKMSSLFTWNENSSPLDQFLPWLQLKHRGKHFRK